MPGKIKKCLSAALQRCNIFCTPVQDREEVRLGRGVHYQLRHQLKALVDIDQLQSDIVKPGDQVENATLMC